MMKADGEQGETVIPHTKHRALGEALPLGLKAPLQVLERTSPLVREVERGEASSSHWCHRMTLQGAKGTALPKIKPNSRDAQTTAYPKAAAQERHLL